MTTEPIAGKDLREGDVITHPSGAFPPDPVVSILARDIYGVTWVGAYGAVRRTSVRATLTVERDA